MARAQGSQTLTWLIGILLAAVLAAGAVYMMQDHRSGSERLGDAAEALPQGVDKAADKLGDQTPAETLKRNAEKATH